MVKKKKTDISEDVEEDLDETMTAAPEDIVDPVAEKLAEASKQVLEYKDIAQRLQAEFDNYRKRNIESVKTARQDGVSEVVIELLPIMDALERAQGMVTDEKSLEGVLLINKQMQAVLAKYDITEIVALGETFNPALHNAVMQVEDSANSGKVVDVLQKGYIRNNKVIRYSMVKVAN